MQVCALVCRGLWLTLQVFFNCSLPYLLQRACPLNPSLPVWLCSRDFLSLLLCLLWAEITGGWPYPPKFSVDSRASPSPSHAGTESVLPGDIAAQLKALFWNPLGVIWNQGHWIIEVAMASREGSAGGQRSFSSPRVSKKKVYYGSLVSFY